MHGADARLKDVADMAGLTSGAILYHFPNVHRFSWRRTGR
jgi:AcrR family transcriptional regulator